MTPTRILAITGVTRGIGRSLVASFVAAGHTVHGCGRSADALAELCAEHPGAHTFTAVDVADSAAVEAWARSVLASGPAPDLLINNAAIINAPAPLWEIPAEDVERLLAINVGGVAHVIRAFVPAMISAGRGVIVNLSSGWGRSTSPDVAPYCASKWAIEGLTRSVAQELPAGLACVALSPGVVDTDMLRLCLPDTAAACDGPDAWAERNAAYVLALDASHNGQSLTAT